MRPHDNPGFVQERNGSINSSLSRSLSVHGNIIVWSAGSDIFRQMYKKALAGRLNGWEYTGHIYNLLQYHIH
jgi:hypothetical protein